MNKKMKLRYLFYLLLICFSCNRSKSLGDFNTIQVDLTNPQVVSLFDYFSHIELIPLETNENSVLGWFMDKIIFHQNRYYVFDERKINVLF